MQTQIARSKFVSGLAWLTIILGALGTLSGASNVMIFGIFRSADTNSTLAQLSSLPNVPPFMIWMLENMAWIGLVTLLLSLFNLVAGIGLLRRLDWGRKLTIATIAFWTISSFGTLWLQKTVFEQSAQGLPPEAAEQAQAMINTMQIVSLICLLIFTAIHIWLIRKLMSPEIRAEFIHSPDLALQSEISGKK